MKQLVTGIRQQANGAIGPKARSDENGGGDEQRDKDQGA
jgi:hypothetical protein